MYCRLLDILADRKAGSGLSGTVLINGEERPRNFRFLAGYVVQVCNLVTVWQYNDSIWRLRGTAIS